MLPDLINLLPFEFVINCVDINYIYKILDSK